MNNERPGDRRKPAPGGGELADHLQEEFLFACTQDVANRIYYLILIDNPASSFLIVANNKSWVKLEISAVRLKHS